MTEQDLWEAEFTDLAPRLDSGEVTSVALTQLMIDRVGTG